jgi:hypothetical protein
MARAAVPAAAEALAATHSGVGSGRGDIGAGSAKSPMSGYPIDANDGACGLLPAITGDLRCDHVGASASNCSFTIEINLRLSD